jgi:branched-chain amino acid transport system permease protein
MKLPRSTLVRSLLIALVAGVILFGLSEVFGQYRNTQLANCALNFCAVAGLTVLIGRSGQISLGHGAFLFVGAYSVALMLKSHSFPNPAASTTDLVLAIIVAIAVTAAIGALAGVAAARLRGPYLAGVTLALALGLPELPTYSHLSNHLGGHTGLIVNSPGSVGGVNTFRWQAWVCCLCALITLVVLFNLLHSRVGRSMEAVRDDEIAASLSGLSVPRVQVLAFIISAATAGLAGGLLAYTSGSVSPDSFPLTLSLDLLAAAVIGGLGTLSGAAYGAVLVTFLGSWSQDIANQFSLSTKVSSNLPTVLFGGVLVLTMLVFPNGVQGLVRRLWLTARAGGTRRAPNSS